MYQTKNFQSLMSTWLCVTQAIQDGPDPIDTLKSALKQQFILKNLNLTDEEQLQVGVNICYQNDEPIFPLGIDCIFVQKKGLLAVDAYLKKMKALSATE